MYTDCRGGHGGVAELVRSAGGVDERQRESDALAGNLDSAGYKNCYVTLGLSFRLFQRVTLVQV